jgi:tetratricopeptide (TPR) repeat protein
LNISALIRAARAADSSGQAKKAEELCLEALGIDPACVDALVIAGSIAARSGRVAEAVNLLRRAQAADPNSYDAARWLATLLMGRDGGSEAIECAKTAVRLRPKEAEAYVVLGLASLAGSEPDQAIRSLRKATELCPPMAGAHHNLGVALQNDERFDEAIEAFKHAIALVPTMIVSHLHLGMAYLSSDQVELAIACAKRSLELSPSSMSAKKLLVDANVAATEGPNGLDHIRRAMEIDPKAAIPHAMMASRLQEQGKFDEAEKSISRAIELEPEMGISYYFLVHNKKIQESDRPFVERIEALAREPNVHPSDRRHIYFALGKAYDDLREFEKAIWNLDLANGEANGPISGPSSDEERFGTRIEGYRRLLTKEVLGRYGLVGISSEKPVFIVGMPRSGTTLLEQVLSRHSEVGAAGELSFWRDRQRRIANLEKGVLNEAAMQASGHDYLHLLESISPGKARVTDKWPSNFVYLGILQLIYPNATFLHATRHPIDTSLSIYMRPFFKSSDVGGRRWKIVASYRQYLETMAHWRETLPTGSFLDVPYEKMVSDPEGTTREVLAYCGLEWEDSCLQPEAGDRQVKTFSKWQVRQPVYTTSVARWRNYEPWLGVFRGLIEDER